MLLVNGAARRARAAGWLDAVTGALGNHLALDVRHPPDVDATIALARAAGEEGAVVIAAGGDGTVGAVARGLATTGGTLGIIPLGTANDLARELGIPRDPVAAAARIALGRAHPTDLVAMNGHPFVSVGGLGLVSRSTANVARVRAGAARALARVAGAAIYRLAATATLFDRVIVDRVRVTVDGQAPVEMNAHGVFVTNHHTCGGGLAIPTGAHADDGQFEIAVIRRMPRPKLLVELARLSAGLPLAPDTLRVVRARRATIETGRDDLFIADGDAVAAGRRFELVAMPGAIGVLR